jgi:hypothetical protein
MSPSLAAAAREEFEVWAEYQLLDPVMRLFRLGAMPTTGRRNDLMNMRRNVPRNRNRSRGAESTLSFRS